MDELKELSARLGGKLRSQQLTNANMEGTSTRALSIRDYRQYSIQIDEYSDSYTIVVRINAALALSINIPERLFPYTLQEQLPGFPYRIYTRDETFSLIKGGQSQKTLRDLMALLKKWEAGKREGFFIYKNKLYVSLSLKRDLLAELDDIIDLITANKDFFKREISNKVSPDKIPDNLKQLTPLLKKYSISDDAEREQLIEEMDEKEKLKILNIINPLFQEINVYLDSFKTAPLNEEALLIGQLAELASILKLNKS